MDRRSEETQEGLIVAGAVNDLNGMDNERRDGVQGFYGAFGTAGKVEDKRGAADGGGTPRQNGAGGFFQALAAHLFRKTGNHFVGDGLGGFGCNVARPKS